jgi:pimeloyl-ACP methyl ester carboxylesterase
LPKFCSKSATIASVQADYVEAAGTSVLVHQWPGRSGRNVLYWHGGGGGSDEWPRIAPALAGVGYSVYAPDAPGYGDSPRLEPEQYLASNIAELGVALIDELALSPVIWIGFSWGPVSGSTPRSGTRIASKPSSSSTAVTSCLRTIRTTTLPRASRLASQHWRPTSIRRIPGTHPSRW